MTNLTEVSPHSATLARRAVPSVETPFSSLETMSGVSSERGSFVEPVARVTRVAAVGVAVPPITIDQAEADRFLTANYGEKLSRRMLDIMHKVNAHPSIHQRHIAIEEIDSLINEHPDARADRFTRWGVGLAERAGREAMRKAGIGAGDISAIIVNTCTGYICPGISTYLVERMGLARDTQAIDLVGTGCGGGNSKPPSWQRHAQCAGGEGGAEHLGRDLLGDVSDGGECESDCVQCPLRRWGWGVRPLARAARGGTDCVDQSARSGASRRRAIRAS